MPDISRGNLDNRSGLPEVPNGYYWEVAAGLNREYYISLMKGDFGGAYSVGSAKISKHRNGHIKDSLLVAASEVLSTIEFDRQIGDYVGTYPPKKL